MAVRRLAPWLVVIPLFHKWGSSIQRRHLENRPVLWTSERLPPERQSGTRYVPNKHVSNEDTQAGGELGQGVYSLVAEHMLSMHKALGSIHSTSSKNN